MKYYLSPRHVFYLNNSQLLFARATNGIFVNNFMLVNSSKFCFSSGSIIYKKLRCTLCKTTSTHIAGTKQLLQYSSQGHSYFEVKVILELNGNVFRFLSRSGRLAFVRMLFVSCFNYQFEK